MRTTKPKARIPIYRPPEYGVVLTDRASRGPSISEIILKKFNCLKSRGCMLSLSEFSDWYNQQPKICSYCSIPEEYEFLARFRLNKNLSIDRMDNSTGYLLSNICLSCALCNTTKGALLTSEEMREIGQKYLKPKWSARYNDVMKEWYTLSKIKTVNKLTSKTFRARVPIYKDKKQIGFTTIKRRAYIKTGRHDLEPRTSLWRGGLA